ncbi:MAG: allophanate hydrolase subunit 1 [Phycisphaerales bacterium]|nr:allophanate hydrolase subunit 1 [Phycisphaerales bacterium]
MSDWELIWASEHAVLVRARDSSLRAVDSRWISKQLREIVGSAIRCVIPSSQGVLIQLDITQLAASEAAALLASALDHIEPPEEESLTDLITIPACYDPALAPDLEPVAQQLGLEVQTLIEMHAHREYQVEALGFSPGFGYLRSLDDRLRLPRRDEPRTRIPPGSIAIAEDMTAVYPSESAGGWHLIARTPLRMFDAQHCPPGMLRVGDRVRFLPIGLDSFKEQEEGAKR